MKRYVLSMVLALFGLFLANQSQASGNQGSLGLFHPVDRFWIDSPEQLDMDICYPYSNSFINGLMLGSDDCLSATALSDGVTLSGEDNIGSTQDITASCTGSGEDYSVWYVYTVSSSDVYMVSVTLAPTGTPISGNVTLAAFDACGGSELACNTGTGGVTLDVLCPPVGDMYIQVASSLAGQGQFNIVANESSYTISNDLCANAEELVDGVTVEGTNLCASANYSYCTVDGSDHMVHYYFDNTSSNKIDLEVLVEPSTATTGIAMQNVNVAMIYDDCFGFSYMGLSPECNALGTTFLISCIPSGDVINLIIGSEDGMDGDFTITVNALDNKPSNDECSNPINITLDDCEWQTVTGSNEFACPEEFDFSACGYSSEPVVWYSFTATPETESFEIANLVGTGDLFLGIFEMTSDCANPVPVAGADCITTDTDEIPLVAGNDYLIAVGSSDGEGTFSFDIVLNDPPENDECAGEEFVPMNSSTSGTTDCANPDYTDPGCPPEDFENAVWYSFTTGPDQNKVSITITSTGIGSPVTLMILDACSGSPNLMETTICDALGTNLFCLEPNTTYYIQIASSDANSGDFDLSIDEVTDPVNDNCPGAIDLGVIPEDCEPYEFTGDNIDACPDDYIDDGCDFSVDDLHGVWYTFTTDQFADFIDIETDLPNALFAIYSGSCGSLTYEAGSCVTGGGDLLDFPVQPNTTYYILISSDVESNTFTMTFTSGEAPENNLCADAIELTNGIEGTNICADAEFAYCSQDINTSHQVYYYYTNNTGLTVDLEVTVNGSTATTGTEMTGVDVLVLSDCDGTYFQSGSEYCSTFETPFIIECIEDGETIILVIGSVDGEEGDFNITYTEYTDTHPENDECTGAIEIDYNICEWITVEGDNTGACPEDFVFGACDYDTDPVVWFKFTATDGATSVEIQELFANNGAPYLGIFEMTTDCDNPVPIGGGDCIQGDAGPIPIVGGMEYLIAFGTSGGEGPFTFDIKVNESPVNDDPCQPDFETFVLTQDQPFLDDNSCATPDFAHCNLTSTYGKTLFYEYTMELDGDLEITVNGITAGGPFTIAAYEESVGCNDPSSFIDENCTDNLLVIQCLKAGDKVIILIGTGEQQGEYGEFEVMTHEVYPDRPDNDECLNAEPFDVLPCEWITVEGDNTNACPEEFNFGGCSFDTEPVVWFSFTATDAATTVEFQELFSENGSPFLGIFEMTSDCANPVPVAGGDCVMGDAAPMPIVAGAEYLIAFGSSGGEGPFTFDIKVNESPINDDPCLPDFETFILTQDQPFPDDNSCATPDFAHCNLTSTYGKTLFYEYTMELDGDLEITVNGITAGGPFTIAAYEEEIGCDDPSNFLDENCTDNLLVIQCLKAGDKVIILIGTGEQQGEYGEFEVMTHEVYPVRPDNDECVNAEPFDVLPCEWITVEGDNTNACPEEFNFGGCSFDTEPVVWFSFTATDAATSVEFQELFSENGSPFLGIFEMTSDCANPVPVAGGDCVMGDTPPMPIVAGAEYLIAFGSGGGEGPFTFDIKVNEAPINDDPCLPYFEPFVLEQDVAFLDDNSCATPDFASCFLTATYGKTLFYEYTMEQDGDLQITVNGITAGGPFTIAGYETSVACNNPGNFLSENCADNVLVIPCLEEGDVVIIMIGTGEEPGQYGEFEVVVDEIYPVRPDNDECDNAQDIEYLDGDLCTWKGPEFNETNVNACSEYSDFGTGCNFDSEEVIWFEFTAPPATAPNSSLSLQFLDYTGTGEIFAAVFYYSEDCTDLVPVSPCVTGPGPHGDLATVQPGETYLIGVGSNGDLGGEFDIEIKITSGPPNDDPCADLTAYDLSGGTTLVDQTNLCSDPDGIFSECSAMDQENAVIYQFEIVEPYYGIQIVITANNNGGTPLTGTVVAGVSETNGTFCGGLTQTPPAYCEDINNATFVFDCLPEGTYQLKISTSDINSGDFDITSTLLEKVSTCDDTNNYDYCQDATDNVIEPLVACEPFTITGCNDDACPEDFTVGSCDFTVAPTVWYTFISLPGATSMNITNLTGADDGAFLVVFEGDCDNLSAVSPCIVVGQDEFEIPIDENTLYFIAIGNTNLVGGSFEFDLTINVPLTLVAIPPEMDLCNGGTVDIQVMIEDGMATNDIQITYIDNPNVEGETELVLTGGSGVINNVLTLNNDNCDVEEVVFIAEIIEEESNCAGDELYIYVYVYPDPTLEQPDQAGSCYPSSQQYDLMEMIDCEGFPGSYEFEWEATENGLSGNSSVITLDDSFGPGLHNFSVTITDELGCSNVDEIEIEIYPLLHFNLESPILCHNDEPIFLCPEFDEPGTPDYYYQWDFDCMGISDDGDCFEIDPAEIDDICGPGTHELTLLVSDQNGCYFEMTTTVTIIGAADFSIYPVEPQICENAAGTEVCLTLYDNTVVDYVEWVTPDNQTIISTVPDYCAFLEDIGDYTINLYDENGCVTSYDFYVDYNLLDDIDIEGDEFVCLGESTELSVEGNYVDYYWSTGETTPTITVTPTENTTFTVNVTDQNGCVGSADILVTVVNTVIETLPDSASFCTGYYTQISAGSGYDTYTWYKGTVGSAVIGTTETITIDEEDWYFVEVTSMGCPAFDSIYVSDNSELTPSVLIGTEQLCYEDESTLVIAIGGVFEYYTWINTAAEPDEVVFEGAGMDSVYLPEGEYELIVEDQLCSGSTQFEIVKLPPVEVEIQPGSDTIDICYGDFIDLYVPEGFIKYEWNTGSFNDTLYNVDHGLYIVTVTDENDCEGVDSVFVRELPPVDPDLGSTKEICEGDVVDLSPGTDFDTYTWYHDGIQVPEWDNQSTVSTDEGGLYHVEVTNSIGCQATDSVLVNKTENLDPSILGEAEFCEGSSVILEADKSYYNYIWTNAQGEVIGNERSIEVNLQGTYYLKVETETGCSGETEFTAISHAPPAAQLYDDIIVACGANSSSGSSILNFNDFVLSTDPGEWSDADGAGVIINGGWDNVDFSEVLPGIYTFAYTTTNAIAPCPNVTEILTIIVEECNCQTFTIEAISDLCNEGSAAFDLNDYIVTDPVDAVFSGSWKLIDGPGFNPLNGSSFNPIAAVEGTYILEFELDDPENWCETTQQTQIQVVAAPVIGTIADRPSFCKGTDAVVELESLIEGEEFGGKWIALNPITGNAFDPVAGTFNTMDQLEGIYQFEYSLEAETPCGDKAIVVELEINPLPFADAGQPAFGCFGDVIQLGGESSNGSEYTYEWKDASGNIVSTERYFMADRTGVYTLTVTNTLTSCISTSVTELEIFEDYVPTLSGKEILVDGETGSITVTVSNLDIDDIEEFIWYKDNDLIPGENGDVIYVNEAGTYCVEVIPRGDKEQACIETACISIGAKITKEVYVPNIFTPNGDGYNEDFYVVSGKNVERILNISIFDRWGELVYQAGGYDLSESENYSWDGYFRGSPAMQGVYVYKVEVLYTDDTTETVAGDLTLIR